MSRDQMIEWLIDNDMDYVQSSAGGLEWLRYALQTGMVGYENRPDIELREEILERDPDAFNKETENA